MSNPEYFTFDSFRLSQSIDLNGFVNNQYGLNQSISNVNNRYNLTSFNDFSNQLESITAGHIDQQVLMANNGSHISPPLLSTTNITIPQNTTTTTTTNGNEFNLNLNLNLTSSPLLSTTTTATTANNNIQTVATQQHLLLQQQQLQLQQLLQQQLQQQQQMILSQQEEEISKLSQQNQLMDHTFMTVDIQTELKELFQSIEVLSQESIQHLFFLCKVIQPQLTEEIRFQLLSKMFSDIPQVIPQLTISNYQSYLQDPSNHALKLFMDFKELANLFAKISYLQLFHLTNNIIPPGTPQTQFTFFIKIQEYFRSVSFERLRLFNTSLGGDSNLSNTFLHVQKLLTLDPAIPIDMVHFVAGIVSLPLGELFQFHHWFSQLSKKLLAVLLAILQLDSSTVLDLKRILATNVPYINDNITLIINNINNYQQQIILLYQQNQQQQQQQKGLIPPIKLELSSNSGFSNTIPQLFPNIDNNNNTTNNNNNNNGSMAMNIESPISPVQNFEISSPPLHTPSSPIQHNTPNTPTVPIAKQEPKTNITSTTTTTSTTKSESSSTGSQTTINNDMGYYLKIARQPPSSTVYQRILKPFPQVMICGPGVENENLSNYYVEATLLRNDDQTELVNCIDGTKTSRFSSGVFAPFKKLKILSTTQQQRTLFRLRFALKRYARNESQSFPEATVLSDPIEVFSHTIYLTDKQDVPLPPTVQEIIPAIARPGTRVVVLGSNFSSGNDLKVYFGQTAVSATFFEKGTIIAVVPPNQNHHSEVSIKVTNDGTQYSSESNVIFNYIP